MHLHIHNDGKGYHDSYECSIVGWDTEQNKFAYGASNMLLTTYGGTEQEAVQAMHEQLLEAAAFISSIGMQVMERSGAPAGTSPNRPQPCRLD